MAKQKNDIAGAKTLGQAGRGFAPAVYFVVALLVLSSVADLLLNMWPWRPGDLGWRYAAVGLGSQFLNTPVLALLLAALYAYVAGHGRVLRTIAVICWAGVGLIALSLVAFALDAAQIRPGVAPAGRSVSDVAVARAAVKLLISAIAFHLMARASWRGARAVAPAAPARHAEPVVARSRRDDSAAVS